MLHVLEACGEKDHNAWIQKCETFEELLQFGNSIMRKAEYRAAADHGGFYNEDQFLKVFLTYAAREKLFQARDGRKAAERKATGTRYFEFQKNLNGFHDNIRRRILSLVPPAFDNH